jgi:aminopeptidase-like protein
MTAGDDMLRFIAEAYPLCRSITGEGVRRTLGMLRERIPIEVHEVPSGTPVFDWTVPREWNVRDAWIKDPEGHKVVDFQASNLHVLNYSVPVHERLPLSELKKHLFTLPDKPDLIPYRTSYYREAWGFCLSHNQLQALPEGEYEVFIDSTLADGFLTYGELFLPGESDQEVLLSTHVCHPSLCNDNLSGIAAMTWLAREMQARPRRYSYRFLFIPGTIGSITWLARNEERAGRIAHGLVAANLGDPGTFHYKKSRQGNAEIDRAVLAVLKASGEPFGVEEFVPFGYDERQYSSPGFNLAVGSLTRTPYGRYPQYHTSADNLDFVRPEALEGSLRTYLGVLDVLEGNRRYLNLNPKCEPQLGRRGLYRTIGGDDAGRTRELALLWVLNLSDGHHTLLDVAERSGMSFTAIREAADALIEVGLLRELEEGE